MADITYLYDSSGTWIAFRKDEFLFAPTGAWLGWFAPGSDRAFDIDGHYLGTQVESAKTEQSHLFHEINPTETQNDNHPGYPGRPDAPDHPGYPGRADVPLGMEEVDLHHYA
jgi:hypothetical protein